MYCEKCGAEITEDSSFCKKCGNAVKKQQDDKKQGPVILANPLYDDEKKLNIGKVCRNVFLVLLIGIVIFVVAFVFYAHSQGESKDGYACQLVTSLLRQNFGDNAAQCKSYTVKASPKNGLWIPEIGIIIDGQDIGVNEDDDLWD